MAGVKRSLSPGFHSVSPLPPNVHNSDSEFDPLSYDQNNNIPYAQPPMDPMQGLNGIDGMLETNPAKLAAAAVHMDAQSDAPVAQMIAPPAPMGHQSGTPPSGSRAKRHQIAVACQRCRTRKSKCDGARPSCASCRNKGCECHYDVEPDATRAVAQKRRQEAMQRKLDQFQEVYQYLRDRPEQEAVEILHRIRQGWDVIDLHAYIKEAETLLPASMQAQQSAGSIGSNHSSPHLDPEGPS